MSIFKRLETLVYKFANEVRAGLEESLRADGKAPEQKSIIDQLYEETGRPLPYTAQQQWRIKEQHNAARTHHGHKGGNSYRPQGPGRRG